MNGSIEKEVRVLTSHAKSALRQWERRGHAEDRERLIAALDVLQVARIVRGPL